MKTVSFNFLKSYYGKCDKKTLKLLKLRKYGMIV